MLKFFSTKLRCIGTGYLMFFILAVILPKDHENLIVPLLVGIIVFVVYMYRETKIIVNDEYTEFKTNIKEIQRTLSD